MSKVINKEHIFSLEDYNDNQYIEEVRQFISALTNFEIFPKDVYFLDKMPSKLSFGSIISISAFSILITILTSLLPSLSVSKIETIKALKYE